VNAGSTTPQIRELSTQSLCQAQTEIAELGLRAFAKNSFRFDRSAEKRGVLLAGFHRTRSALYSDVARCEDFHFAFCRSVALNEYSVLENLFGRRSNNERRF
jgi:hypothetical protein